MLFVRYESRVYGNCFGCGVRASGFVGAAGKVLNLFSVFPVLKFCSRNSLVNWQRKWLQVHLSICSLPSRFRGLVFSFIAVRRILSLGGDVQWPHGYLGDNRKVWCTANKLFKLTANLWHFWFG